MAVTYRLATQADAPAIAKLHAESWRVAYRGMFPDDFLDNDAFDDRDRVWRTRFADPDRETKTLTVLAEKDSELVGFAHSIYDEDPEHGTLLDNLHVRRTEHRSGIGRRLLAETATRLTETGRAKLYLWVLEDNHNARRFYAAMAGVECGRGLSSDSNPQVPPVPSIRICWPDAAVLIS